MPKAVSGGKYQEQKQVRRKMEVRQVEKDVMNAVLASELCNSSKSGDLGAKVEKTCGVKGSSSGVVSGKPFPRGQSWDCSQTENAPEEISDGLANG